MSYQPATTRTPDAERAKLLRILHREGALRRLSHDDLRGGANLAFGVDSLADLTLSQLRQCIQSLCVKMPVAPVAPVAPASRRCLPDSSTASTRPRRGQPGGNLRMITGKQRSFIGRLRGELGLTPTQLDDVIAREFGVVGMSEIRTTVEAGKLINLLIGMNRQRHRTFRGPRMARS